jgi:hypothetical protein
MKTIPLSIKVSENFAKNFRKFCEEHCLQIGKFAESTLSEIMEDYYFGQRAQKVLSSNQTHFISHEEYFKD